MGKEKKFQRENRLRPKISRLCMASGWLSKYPFCGCKAKLRVVEHLCLIKGKILTIYEEEFAPDRLKQVS